jgi:hypothetical protein
VATSSTVEEGEREDADQQGCGEDEKLVAELGVCREGRGARRLCSSPSPVLVAKGIATTAATVRTTTGHAHRARIAGQTAMRTAPSTAIGSSTTTAWTMSGWRGSPETNVGTLSLSSGTAFGPIVATVPQRFLGAGDGAQPTAAPNRCPIV